MAIYVSPQLEKKDLGKVCPYCKYKFAKQDAKHGFVSSVGDFICCCPSCYNILRDQFLPKDNQHDS